MIKHDYGEQVLRKRTLPLGARESTTHIWYTMHAYRESNKLWDFMLGNVPEYSYFIFKHVSGLYTHISSRGLVGEHTKYKAITNYWYFDNVKDQHLYHKKLTERSEQIMKRLDFSNKEEAVAYVDAETHDPCVDNHRFAFLDDEVAMENYYKQQLDGCCGSMDITVTVKGVPATVGCNYGH